MYEYMSTCDGARNCVYQMLHPICMLDNMSKWVWISECYKMQTRICFSLCPN